MAAKNTGYKGFDYGVVTDPRGESTGTISCFPSNITRCVVIRQPKPVTSGGFVSPSKTTSFHDDILVKCTRAINAVISEVMDEIDEDAPSKSLHILITDDGPMLAWLDTHIIDDDGQGAEASCRGN